MASTPIAESYMIVVSVIAASILSAAVIPTISQITQVYLNEAQDFKSESETGVDIVFAFGAAGESTVSVWVKNTGKTRFQESLIEQSDVFFGPTGNFSRIPYNATTAPKWNYTIENDIDSNEIWNSLETLKVTITLTYSLSTGDYYIKFATYQGSWSESRFSV